MGRHGDEHRRGDAGRDWSVPVAASPRLCRAAAPGRPGWGEETLRRDGHVGIRLVICCAHGMWQLLSLPAYDGSTAPTTDLVARAALHMKP